MEKHLLKMDNVTKIYGQKKAIEDVSILIKPGKIYGFIGENGAGKTTTIRILSGLSEPTTGSFELFGKTSNKNLEEARKKVGCLVEHPILAMNKTAMENLKMQSILYNKENVAKPAELLERVGLADVGNKRVGDFSLGMKQRLGIALSLIQQPKLLILDEPTNGLDPMGMVDVRKLLQSLNENEGITILISSHILTELYRLVTDYIIISHGKIIAQMSHEELDAKCSPHIVMEADNIKQVVDILKNKLQITKFEVKENQLHLYEYAEDIRRVAKIIFDAGIMLTKLTIVGKTLEEYYIELLGRN